ncbi:YjdF family protein [Oscillospiraceae bacterium PP1C4]
MCLVTAKLTVYFEEPFWVGVYERTENGKLEVSRVVFGAEPKDNAVYDFFLTNWSRLRFSPPVAQQVQAEQKINPKRMQRAIQNQLSQTGIGTKAQQALRLQQEQNKLERKAFHRQRSQEEQERQFALRQQKKKEKHKGR